MPRNQLFFVIVTVLCCVLGRAAEAAPRVVVSIKPIHSLVAGVMAGVGAPELLVKGGSSPHTYSLKPSDAQVLNTADVVFWIGPGFEGFLEKPLKTLAASAKVVALMDTPGLTRIGAGANPAEIDRHIWLDPINAKVMVAAITKALVEADPANAARYSGNASMLATRLDALYFEIENMVAPLRAKPFIVFHDAYEYFQARYRLNVVGVVAVDPERMPGAKHISLIREKITASGALCVFTEPGFEPKVMGMLVDGTKTKTGVLDPEGAALTPGPELYFTLMNSVATNLSACLKAQ